MIVNPLKSGQNTKDATIKAKDVLWNEVAYGKDGRIVGEVPLSSQPDAIYGTTIEGIENNYSVCFGNDLFVAVQLNSNVAAYSTNGIHWTQTALPSYATWQAVCYGNERFVALAGGTNIAAYSTDGINWTQTTLPSTLDWYSLCYGNGLFLAVTYYNSVAAYSPDGINWTAITLPTNDYWEATCYGNNEFLLVGDSTILHSSDCVTWTETETPQGEDDWWRVCYLDGFYMLSPRTSAVYAISTDGINWTQHDLPYNVSVGSLCCGSGVFVMIPNDPSLPVLYMSPQTENLEWKTAQLHTKSISYANRICAGCYGNSKFIAIDDYGVVSVWIVKDHQLDSISSVSYILEDTENGMLIQGSDGHQKTLTVNEFGTIGFEGEYNTSDATITAVDIGYGEVAYGKNGEIIGMSPFIHISGDLKLGALPEKSKASNIAYGAGIYVMVCNNTNYGYMSADGLNWSKMYLPTTANWCSVTYGNGMFVAVAFNSKIAAYSSNGINWTQVGLPSKLYWYECCYGNGTFVCIAQSGKTFLYSVDGITWASTTLSTTASNYMGVCYGGDKFVAVSGNTNSAAYSTDGITWIEMTMPQKGYWESVCYNGEKFVAVGYGYGDNDLIAYSINGIDWEQVTTFTYTRLQSVCYGNNKFVAIGSDESNLYAYSNNGIDWVYGELPTSGSARNVVYNVDKFIIISPKDNYILYSFDGVVWHYPTYVGKVLDLGNIYLSCNDIEHRKLIISDTELKFDGDYNTSNATINTGKELLSNQIGYTSYGCVKGTAPLSLVSDQSKLSNKPHQSQCIGICYGNGIFVSASRDSSTVCYSYDGINWNTSILPESAKSSCICYGNGMFLIATTEDYSRCMYSTDAITWNVVNITNYSISHMCYGNGVFVGMSSSSLSKSQFAAYSSDGINWTDITIPFENKIYVDICYGNGKFIAVALDGKAAYSTDCINWTTFTIPVTSTNNYHTIIYCKDRFILTNGDAPIQYSFDGITWIEQTGNINGSYAYYGNNKYIILNYDGTYGFCSDDMITWNTFYSDGFTYGISGICYGNDIFICVGDHTSTILYSADGVHWFTGKEDTYKLENTVVGMNITAEGCEVRHIVVEDSKVKFTDEPIIITSTTEVTEGSASNYPENSLYVVYKEE